MSERSLVSKFELQVANLCNLRLFANSFVFTVFTHLLIRFCWKLIYMYVARLCMSEIIDIFEISFGGCKLCNLRFFGKKSLCAWIWLFYINPIMLKIDINVRYAMKLVWYNWFLWKHYWYLQIYATYDFCKYICVIVCTVLTDLLT